jgi:hypothetical protein
MMTRTIAVLAFLCAAPALTIMRAQSHFTPGYKSTHGGISISIIRGRTTPRTRAEGTDGWILEWTTKRKADRAQIVIVSGSAQGLQNQISFVSANPKALPSLHNPEFMVPLSGVVKIQISLLTGNGKVVGKPVEFQ